MTGVYRDIWDTDFISLIERLQIMLVVLSSVSIVPPISVTVSRTHNVPFVHTESQRYRLSSKAPNLVTPSGVFADDVPSTAILLLPFKDMTGRNEVEVIKTSYLRVGFESMTSLGARKGIGQVI